MMKITGARVIIECLVEQGIDTVFGYPGGAILNVYDELYKNKDRIKHILTAHEQGASHAADGYSRATGKTGVVLATSGPGATNLVTGIATAYMDSIPMVAITCNVTTPLLGKDSFQEVDITGITMPITKHSYIVRNIDQLAGAIREAFFIAQSGRPGPVLIDVPKDVTANVTDFEPLTKEELANFETLHLLKNIKRVNAGKTYEDSQIEEVSKLINSAVRPYIYAGGGIISSGACEEVKTLAEKANIPVGVSLMAKTAFPANHPLNTGMIGMHGTKASNFGVTECDLLIAIGARFSDRVVGNAKKFAPKAKVLHIDVDPAEINKNVPAATSIIGDVKEVLTILNKKIEKAERTETLPYYRYIGLYDGTGAYCTAD
jgi:acetolactate synthase-1/2/3 large subunit